MTFLMRRVKPTCVQLLRGVLPCLAMPSNSLFSLESQVILVTGASRGIGAAIAKACAAHGARIALAARKQPGLDQVAAEIREAGGVAFPIAAHMGRPAEVAGLFDRVEAELGACTGLVNNAATNPYFGPMIGIEDAAFDKTFEVNVKGYFEAAREFALRLRKAGHEHGSIVNLASIAGMRAAPFQGIYGMTKAAVISMTQTLSHELGSTGIRCNAICPGLIETKFAAAIVGNDTLRSHIVGRTSLGRHGQPEEIAGGAVYLLSHASSYVTGQTLVIDGGVSAS